VKTYLVFVRSKPKVLDSFSGVLGPPEEECITSSRSSQGQLIQSQSLSTCGEDTSTSGCSKSEGSNAELGNNEEAVVIGDCANNDNGLVVRLLGGVRDNSGDGNRRPVDAGHEKPAKNNLIEG
jgi:hypothetical protein